MSRIALATLTHGMEFVARTASDHEVRMDAAEKVGGEDKAARPAEMPFVGLAGCTGMDAISILRKMRQEVATFAVAAEGLERTTEHPKRWTAVRVIFEVTGDVDPAKLEKAINLSRNRYCGVSASLRPAVRIEYRYVLNGSVTDLGEAEPEVERE
ncbi:MAG: Protein YhfA [Calditrichaeota bacterium]|nr:Protein YhfA [Calditrichota bacterium]